MMLLKVVLTERPSKWIQSTGAGLFMGGPPAEVDGRDCAALPGAKVPLAGICWAVAGGVAGTGVFIYA